jgi:hypothetical protein
LVLEHVFWWGGVTAEIFLLAIFLYRRTYKTFPVFCLYVAWCLISDLAEYYAIGHFRLAIFTGIYSATEGSVSLFQIAVLLEVSGAKMDSARHRLVDRIDCCGSLAAGQDSGL